MKFRMFILLMPIAVFVLMGCPKKSAPPLENMDSENKAVSTAQSEIRTQSEHTANTVIEQETPSSEFDAWSDEEAYAMAVLMKHANRPDASAVYGERPDVAGLIMFTYFDMENDRMQKTFAPVINSDFYDSQKQRFEKYPSVKQEEFAKMDTRWYASSAASVIAFHEKDTPRNLVTILFSTDRWKSWNESSIEIDPASLNDEIRVLLSLTCPTGGTTGYLLVTRTENERKMLNGGILYRTQDLGKSWELASVLPKDYKKAGALFAQGDVIIAPTSREDKYFSFYKSTDGVEWKRVELPLDTKKYKAVGIFSMSFDGNYGYVEVFTELREENEKKNEREFFVTKDGGETWVLWNNKRNIFVM